MGEGRGAVVVGAGWMSGRSFGSVTVLTTGARAIWVVDDMAEAGKVLGGLVS